MRDAARIALCVSLLSIQSVAKSEESQAAPATGKITITGFLNQCYGPDKWLVFITSFPGGRFESETRTLGKDGRFRFVLDPAELTPGTYIFQFGKTKKGAGAKKFTVTSATTTIDFGVVGECDI